ncbi:lantibiotic dehydratase [Planomonospora algeriensis]
MITFTRYQHTGLVLVRATTDPGGLEPPTHLDLSDPAVTDRDGREWLAAVWSRREVREALQMASPALAARTAELLDSGTASVKDLRRAITSVSSYLLRWQRRATPFGLFAGVAAATIGPAAAKVGTDHRVLARADAEWVQELVDRLESHPGLRPALTVVADSTAIVRDGRLIVARQAEIGARTPGPPREVSTRHTRPVQVAMAAAAAPIRFDALAAHLAAHFPAAAPEKISGLLHALVDQRILITSLRPPMTAADPLTHLISALRAAGTTHVSDVAAVLAELEDISARLTRHNTSPDPQQAVRLRTSAAEQMTALVPGTGPVLAADVLLDARVSIPERVLEEAALAAGVLLRIGTKPFGTAAWLDYHARFRARYGPGALVPVRELVADSGLGYPGGYLGAPRARPAWRTLTERDTTMLALIQRAALNGAQEIALTDADVQALTVGDHGDMVPPQRIEFGAALHAASTAAIDAGQFELWVTASPRAYTSMAGRFAPLLDGADRDRLTASYAAAGDDDAVVVQVSFPPRRPHNANVTRVPRLVPAVVSLAEHPDGDGQMVGVDDLAVTADAAHMYLVQRSTGRRVIPRIPHALDTAVQSPPLARFIAEVADARSAVFGPLDFGAARVLPYIPRIRYRRTVLAAARWTPTSSDLPTSPTGQDWESVLGAWRDRWQVPARVVLCAGELRLPLDLDQPLDRALLRARLERTGRIELTEDGGQAGQGWIGRPAELLIPMTLVSPPPRRLPVMAAPGALLRPGASPLVHAQLVGNPARFDELLTRRLPAFAAGLDGLVQRWWVSRYRNMVRPEADQYLAVTLRLADPALYGPVAERLAAFAADLHARGLPAHLTLASLPQHPARYGDGPALEAAEQVFAADTAAAVAQLAMAEASGLPAQALAAASMAHLAAHFTTDPVSGYRALLDCLPQQTGPLERALRDHVLHLAAPGEEFPAVRALSSGDAVAAAWQVRQAALAAYHHVLAAQRDPATVLRTLLHEHHVRAVGVDPETEKVTGRLARAAALRALALAGAL